MASTSMSASSSYLYDYLSKDLCSDCSRLLKSRINELEAFGALDGMRIPAELRERSSSYSTRRVTNGVVSTPARHEEGVSGSSSRGSSTRSSDYGSVPRKGLSPNASSPATDGSISGERHFEERTMKDIAVVEGDRDDLVETDRDDRREWWRMSKVGRKKDFRMVENVKGKDVNVLQGLELHTKVFNSKEQEKIINHVYRWQKLGREGRLRERTYSEPKKWMRGKGRVTLQFGCCYNYAVDKDGNPPGILREEEVDPLPPLFKLIIQRMVRWRVLPPSCVPNSCIVNIYDKGDCIPPHIDHHDFLRPFCTISFLAECNILFGQNIEIAGPGEFRAPIAIPLPVGSVFILSGNGADVAKHCVPGVPAKRISITFRKMDPAKIPYSYSPDPTLQGLVPLAQPPTASPPKMVHASPHLFMSNQQTQQQRHNHQRSTSSLEAVEESNVISKLTLRDDDFPPLGGSSTTSQRRKAPHGRSNMH